MKKLGLVAFAVALLGASPPADPGKDAGAGELSTERRVHGVITSIEPAKLTIASSQHAVTGKIDPARTKVTINGQPGKASDLKLTAHAKGELCLDDVWLAIDTH
ncbi:MAG: hypothetical protein K0S65_6431 [Labilithrix sp.]|nr:hypothetical protein [Labilithrix sp.]